MKVSIFCCLINFIFRASSEWSLISSDFYQIDIEPTQDWIAIKQCNQYQEANKSVKQCETNPLNYIRLTNQILRLEKNLFYPHFQLRIITDAIYFRSDQNEHQFEINIRDSSGSTQLFKRSYNQYDLKSYGKVCMQSCCESLDSKKIEIKKYVISGIVHQNANFNISYCFQPKNELARIGLRNILIYANACHISCSSCRGGRISDCLTCYQGSPTDGGLCKCDESNKYTHRLTGCLQECPRNYYLSDNSYYCQFNPRIQSYIQYFTQSTIYNYNLLPYEPWVYVPDPFHINQTRKIFSCSGLDMVGQFRYFESMTLTLPQHQGIVLLRIRVSFRFFGWQAPSVLRITVDQYSQMSIEKTELNYTVLNGTLNKFERSICQNDHYDLLRIETVLRTYTTTPKIQLQAIQKLDSEFWSFNNVTIDYGLCQSNCTKCETYSKCLVCESNFKLYRGTCVQQCPMHSYKQNECVDYEDLIENSRYLIKAFYDMNTTFEEVDKAVDNFTDFNNNLKTSFTGAIYSFVPEKSVLGGVLVWNEGKFQKTFFSLKPHYKISYKMNVTYGDDNNGWFQYKFDTFSSSQISNPKSGTQNLIGNSNHETTLLIQNQQSHNQDQLDIVLFANVQNQNIDEAFMYISEYFVIVHYCVPFCTACSGPKISDCNSGQYSGYNSTHYCSSNQYLQFDNDAQTHSCQTCSQLGCLECKSNLVCTRCEFSESVQYVLDQGECICYPSAYLSNNQCLSKNQIKFQECNRYCASCFGSNYDQCYTCNLDFHRSIYEFKCLCLEGFYDDGYNLECVPICGDQIIVDGEDCDDGNSNPFDGCDQCSFKCQDECLNCHQGKCYQCKDGFNNLNPNNLCLPICGDSKINGNEQCDDGIYNHNIQNRCLQCKFKCDVHCINCFNGYCFECDESNGWYLKDFNKCEQICGDRIVVKDYEQCDDYNKNPFDMCDNCMFGCSEHCVSCYNGLCLGCEDGFKFRPETQQCQPICGDSIIVGNEQCENALQIVINSCNQCQYKCDNMCLLCNFNQCLKCESGYYLRNNKCEEGCGDGFIVGVEECEQIHNNISSSCLSCRYYCGSGCVTCTQGMCELCKEGYFLEQFECKPICGDSIVVYPEACDDANLEPYDGCHFCQYSCVPQCRTCSFGECIQMEDPVFEEENQEEIDFDENLYRCSDYCISCQTQDICLICQEHFKLTNDQCIPICGDGVIIPGLEQCEDGNDLPYDGCYQCQFQCSEGCLECEKQNKCIKCKEDDLFILDNQTNQCFIKEQANHNNTIDDFTQIRCGLNEKLIDNLCVILCGNGELNLEFEACDDGNYLGGDGCSQTCIMENFYQCINLEGQQSQCTYVQPPDLRPNLLTDKMNTTQIVELFFSQKVKLPTDLLLEDIIVFTINPITHHQLFINPIKNLSTTLDFPIYQIYITFLEPIKDPILEVNIAKSIIINQFDLNLQKYQIKIKLGNPFVLLQTTKDRLSSIVKMNDVAIYSTVAISSIAILTGNTIMFVNLLDLLQSLSYLKYMQYQFPPHLIEFLSSYTKVSLQPILDYFKIDQLLTKLNGGTLPFQKKINTKQSQSNPSDQFFLMNAKSCFFSMFASLMIYLACCILSSNRLNKIINQYSIDKVNQRNLKIIFILQRQLQIQTQKLKNEYCSLGIFNVYQAILHQFLFSSFLQFPDYKFTSLFKSLDSLISICSLVFILISSLKLLSITTSTIKDFSKSKYFYKDSKKQFWAVNSKSFQIYRIILYIFIIVEFANFPQIQSILLSMQSLFYLIYLVKFTPLLSSFELQKLYQKEFLFMIITGSFLIYSFQFSYDNYMLFGWIHIGLISLMLFLNLIVDLFERIQKIYKHYRKNQEKLQLQEINKYINNPLQRLVFHQCKSPFPQNKFH